jgi:hypothetical protein
MRVARGLGLAAVVLLSVGATVRAGEVIEPEPADAIEATFDDAGVLHVVSHVATRGPNELIHRSLAPGGTWSAPESLAPDFAIAGPQMELVRRPDGATCLFFDGWRIATDVGTVGLFLRCLEGGAWTAAQQVGVGVGVTATFDGAFDSSGTPHDLHAVHGQIGFGNVDLGAAVVDAGWPRLAIDGDGTLHAAWAAFGNPIGVFTSRSRDGGITWTDPESLTGIARADAPFDLVADRSGSIHLLIPGSPAIYRKWTRGAWTPMVELPTVGGTQRLTVAADGLATVAWAAPEGVSVFRQRQDGAWAPPVHVDLPPAPPGSLAVAADADGVVVVARRDAAGVSVASVAADGFVESVPSPGDISLDPVIVVQSAAIAAGVVLLVPVPAQLFNQTIEANYTRISGAFAGLRRRLNRARSTRASIGRRLATTAGFFLVAAVISAFLDPTLALTPESGATIVGLFVGLIVVAFAFTLPSVALHRLRSRGAARLELRTLGLPIAVASVMVSRVTSFEPGYLYGLLAGVTLVGPARPGDEARGVALSSAWVLVLAIVAWFGLVPVRVLTGLAAPPLWAVAAEAALATIVVSGLESLLFGLLPLAITPGGVLFRERRRLWAAFMAVSAFAFFHVLVNPKSGYLVDSSRVPVLTTVALFVAFCGLTAGTWLYFRVRPGPPAATPPPSAA